MTSPFSQIVLEGCGTFINTPVHYIRNGLLPTTSKILRGLAEQIQLVGLIYFINCFCYALDKYYSSMV